MTTRIGGLSMVTQSAVLVLAVQTWLAAGARPSASFPET